MLNVLAVASALIQVQCPSGTTIPAGQNCPLVDPFFLFFDWDSSEITPASAHALDTVAQIFHRLGDYTVAMSSQTDRSGTDDYNFRLALRRAERVRAYLVSRGIPPATISIRSFGESRPLVETPDGVREPQNRNVQIVLVPPRE